jgi:hypothetical protein
MKYSFRNLLSVLVAVLPLATALPTSAQLNTRLISNLPLGAGNGEVWAEGNYAYVTRGHAGLDIIDASNQSAPVKVATILPFAHACISDVQVIGNLAYLSNEITNGSPTPHVGMFIFDVSNPLAPVELSRLEWGAGGGYHLGCDAHSVTVDEPVPGTRIAYLSSGITGDLALFDVSNPALPVYLSEILSPVWSYNSQAHDAVVKNGRCYTSWLGGGFTVHDVSNPTAPVLLAHQPNANVNSVFTYHLALSTDGLSLVTTENTTGTDAVKIWNISNLGAITLSGSFVSPGGATPHQVSIRGNYAYLAYLTDGLRVLDLSNPAAPLSVGHYDPEPGSGGAMTGGWGVFPTANNIYLSHSTGGLYIVDLFDTITITKADWRKNSKVLVVEATSTAAPSATLTVAGRGVMTYNVSLNKYTFTQSGVLSKPSTVTVTSDLGATRSATVRRVNN